MSGWEPFSSSLSFLLRGWDVIFLGEGKGYGGSGQAPGDGWIIWRWRHETLFQETYNLPLIKSLGHHEILSISPSRQWHIMSTHHMIMRYIHCCHWLSLEYWLVRWVIGPRYSRCMICMMRHRLDMALPGCGIVLIWHCFHYGIGWRWPSRRAHKWVRSRDQMHFASWWYCDQVNVIQNKCK